MSKQGKKLRKQTHSYGGIIVTPENRRSLLGSLSAEFINNFAKEFDDNDELFATSQQYARDVIAKERKHYKAFLEGKSQYKYKGAQYLVTKVPFEDEGSDSE